MCKVYKQFILLLGMFLCANVATAAQMNALQIVPAQEAITPISAVLRTVPMPVPAVRFRPSTNRGKSVFHFSYSLARPYARDHSLQDLESLSSMREVKTLFSTRSSLPLVELWGGRLRLDGFTNTLDMQNVQLGPSGGGSLQDFRLRRQNYPDEPRSVTLDGVSLTFHFGRSARIGRPVQIWRCLARIVSALR
jgi:hypothetical protein